MSQNPTGVLGEAAFGVDGVWQDTRIAQSSRDSRFGKYFGNPDTRGNKHLFCGLGKMQKAPFMMVTYFAKDDLIPEAAEPGLEEHRP